MSATRLSEELYYEPRWYNPDKMGEISRFIEEEKCRKYHSDDYMVYLFDLAQTLKRELDEWLPKLQ